MLHQQVFTSFAQQHLEPFYAAWWRFNKIVEKIPCHSFSNRSLTLFFYNGLNAATRSWVDNGALAKGGHLLTMNHEGAMFLLNDMADFDYHWHWDPSLQGWSHQYPPHLHHPNIINNSFVHQEEKKSSLEETLAQLENNLKEFKERPKMFKDEEESFNLQSSIQVVENMVWNDNDDSSWNFESLNEIEPKVEDQDPFGDTITPLFSNINTCSIDMDVNMMNEPMSSLNHEFSEDQITSMVMDSPMESEDKLEGVLETVFHEDESKIMLEGEEEYENIDLNSSMILTYTTPTDPYFPMISLSPYYELYPLKGMEFPSYDRYSKPCVVGVSSRIVSYLAKLEGLYNEDPYVVLYDTYYGRQPLFDECFSNSQADDYKSSTFLQPSLLNNSIPRHFRIIYAPIFSHHHAQVVPLIQPRPTLHASLLQCTRPFPRRASRTPHSLFVPVALHSQADSTSARTSYPATSHSFLHSNQGSFLVTFVLLVIFERLFLIH